MSNLLPARQKREAWARVRDRLVLVCAAAIAVSACVALLSLIPAYLVAKTALASNAPEQAVATSTGPEEKALADSQAILSQLGAYASTSTPAEVVRDIIGRRPNGVVVRGVDYAMGSPSTLIVRGMAANRDLVKDYRFALSADPRFISVTVPISALVGTAEGEFTMTITGKF